MESMDTSMDSREVAGIQVRMELQRKVEFRYGIAEISGMQVWYCRDKWYAGKYGNAEVSMEMQRKREYRFVTVLGSARVSRGKWYAGKYGDADVGSSGKYGIAEVGSSGKYGIAESNLPVDIPTVKGKWPYRYVSEFPLRVRMN
ncbi:hypothetical protein T03_13429 [Trichinella britovi]|uniref:Uncharacterized protein n=1 Tax=Trichinella britovi TaxID=45882 RepID=A0A0V1CG15_TRIBR|nr:hypothetical protein T03_13429 [Trichinella britovi]